MTPSLDPVLDLKLNSGQPEPGTPNPPAPPVIDPPADPDDEPPPVEEPEPGEPNPAPEPPPMVAAAARVRPDEAGTPLKRQR